MVPNNARTNGVAARRTDTHGALLPALQITVMTRAHIAATAGITEIARRDCGASQGTVSTPGRIMKNTQKGRLMSATSLQRHSAIPNPKSIKMPDRKSSIGSPGMLCRGFGSPFAWNIKAC